VRQLGTAILLSLLVLGPSAAQSPLNPAGWSDLYTWSRTVGYWINGERICGIKYDPVKLAAQIDEIAAMIGASSAKLRSEGAKRADEFVPHVTKKTCREARAQAKRMGLLPGRSR
jgi:hypothetical protein